MTSFVAALRRMSFYAGRACSSVAKAARVTRNSPSLLEQYVTSAPAPQNAVDIFRGEWSSQFPDPLSQLDAGSLALFEDDRIRWFANHIGGVGGKSVLELGPLEGGHSYMLEGLGAARIVAIESNTRAFLKCLIVKELLGLKHVQFLCGDFVAFLRTDGRRHDVCVASGVLYHMQDPVELIALLAEHCTEHVFIWTHYYDHTIIRSNPRLGRHFKGTAAHEYRGYRYMLYKQEYGSGRRGAGFCGSGAPATQWMTRNALLGSLEHFGFEVTGIAFDEPNHPNGPALAFVARRRT
jgi:hypothetical protein